MTQSKGTKHTPQNRRTPSGKTIPTSQDRPADWTALVAPGPKPKAREIIEENMSPQRSFVLLENHPHAPANAPARRERRPALVAQAKAARRAAR